MMECKEYHPYTILQLDIDCFYIQVEELENPALKEQKVAIKQKNIVVTCNYAARNCGIEKLMSLNEALKRCPDLVVVNGEDLTRYKKTSERIHELLEMFSDKVEKLGLDENWLELHDEALEKLYQENGGQMAQMTFVVETGQSNFCSCGCYRRLVAATHLALKIRQTVFEKIGITASAGIAHNKLLAKLVGGFNKPNKQTVIFPPITQDFMKSLGSVTKVYGVGSKTAAQLKIVNITTIEELQQSTVEKLSNVIDAKTASRLKLNCFGHDDTRVKSSGKPKSIGLEDAFRLKYLSTMNDVRLMMQNFLEKLLSQIEEDSRFPFGIKVTVRKFWTEGRMTRQAAISRSLFRLNEHGIVQRNNNALEKLMQTTSNLFQKMVNVEEIADLTLLGVAFMNFQVEKLPSNTIIGYLRPNQLVASAPEISISNGTDEKKKMLPNNVDREVFESLPGQIQTELLQEWKSKATSSSLSVKRLQQKPIGPLDKFFKKK